MLLPLKSTIINVAGLSINPLSKIEFTILFRITRVLMFIVMICKKSFTVQMKSFPKMKPLSKTEKFVVSSDHQNPVLLLDMTSILVLRSHSTKQ